MNTLQKLYAIAVVITGLALLVIPTSFAADVQSSGNSLGPSNGPAKRIEAPRHPNLDRGLNRILEAPEWLETADSLGYRTLDGRIQVVVVPRDGRDDEVAAWLEDRDARHMERALGLVQAHVPPHLLPLLDAHTAVAAVRRPHYVRLPEDPPPPSGKTYVTAVTEGLAAMGMSAWHGDGYRGEGIKIGVIDPEMGRWDELFGSDLPESNRVRFMAYGGLQPDDEGVHGTACAEIVTDLAPDLNGLYLAMVGTRVDIANAITWMRNNGVKVITMSAGWLTWGPGDGSGALADVVNAFVNAGGVWANSAGNSRLAHYQATFNDTDADNWHNFDGDWEINYITDGAGNKVEIPADTDVLGAMVWNEWSSPPTDLDFYLYFWDGSNDPTQVAGSDYEQSGQPDQWPIEEFSYTAEQAGYYGYAIQRYSGSALPDLEFFNRFDANPLQFNVQRGSIIPPADAAGAIAVAAVNASSPYVLESYSSKGPTNGPGGDLTGGSIKPDLSGYANVSTAVYGPRAFSGTSAAAPHIAGAAAVVWSANPTWTGSQVRSFLEDRATDMGAAGKDIDYGHGRLTLGTPTGTGGGGGGGGGGDTTAYTYWVPVAAHAAGDLGSEWRTDFGALNRTSTEASIVVSLHTSTTTYSGTGTVSANSQALFPDIVGQLTSADTQGTLEVGSSQPLFVTSRTFNQVGAGADCFPDGTFGQYLEGVEASSGMVSGQSALLPHLMQNPDFRCNIGVANFGSSSASVTIKLYDHSGAWLKDVALSIPAGQVKQENRIYQVRAGRNNLLRCYAKVVVNSGSGIVAYASVVDQVTGDGTTIPMRR